MKADSVTAPPSHFLSLSQPICRDLGLPGPEPSRPNCCYRRSFSYLLVVSGQQYLAYTAGIWGPRVLLAGSIFISCT